MAATVTARPLALLPALPQIPRNLARTNGSQLAPRQRRSRARLGAAASRGQNVTPTRVTTGPDALRKPSWPKGGHTSPDPPRPAGR